MAVFKKKKVDGPNIIANALSTLHNIVKSLDEGIEVCKQKIDSNKFHIDSLVDENLKFEEHIGQADKAKTNIKNLLG